MEKGFTWASWGIAGIYEVDPIRPVALACVNDDLETTRVVCFSPFFGLD